jgi:two-component system nitrogen regulation response regulator NtrX
MRSVLKGESLQRIIHYQQQPSTPTSQSKKDDNSNNNMPKFYDLPYQDAKESFEKTYIEYKLQSNSGNISKTAESIGMYPSNLHAKIKKLGLKVQE